MAREGTQQQNNQTDRQANASTGATGAASTTGASGAGTQSHQADRERSITTNREQSRQGRSSAGVARRSGSALSRQGRGDLLDSPLMLMQRMAQDMDRLFEQFGFGRGTLGLAPSDALFGNDSWNTGLAGGSGTQSLWAPQIDVLRRGDKLVVRADVPGMRKEDLHVDVEDNVLTIRGERREEHEDNDEGVFRTERSYGEFYRAIPLPEGVNAEQCEATYENGVLEIAFKAPEQERSSRRIPIR